MNKKTFLLVSLLAVLLSACNQQGNNSLTNNPLLMKWDTPYNVPPFDKVKPEHYMPAFKEAMKRHNEEIRTIVSNTESPDFENTILAFDQSGILLSRVDKLFDNIRSAHTNDKLDEIAREVTPMISKHKDEIFMNEDLFKKIRSVYKKRHQMGLDDQQIRVVEKHYQDFERRGSNLEKAEQDRLKKVNEELSNLELKFGENLLAETNKNFKLVIDHQEDLAGLPQPVIDNAASAAREAGMEGKWVFTLQKPSMIPFLQYA